MSKYAIVTDASCDLSKEYRDANKIDYVQMMINWKDDKGDHETGASLDWDVLSAKEFYDILRSGIRIFTSMPSEQNYRDIIEPHLEAGEDVLYLACSSGLSASLNIAIRLNEEEWKAKYPKRRVIVLDTLLAGMAQGLLIMRAVDLKNEGKSLDELVEILEAEKRTYKEVGIPETLKYLGRAGRVKAAAVFFGNLVSLKPILVFDDKGVNHAVDKAFGRKAAYAKMADMIAADIVDPENQTIYLMNADCNEKDINAFKEAVLAKVKVKEIISQPLGPIIGASSGPGTIIVNYRGK